MFIFYPMLLFRRSNIKAVLLMAISVFSPLSSAQEWREGPRGPYFSIPQAEPVAITLLHGNHGNPSRLNFRVTNPTDRNLCFFEPDFPVHDAPDNQFYSLTLPDGEEVSWSDTAWHSARPYQLFHIVSPGHALETGTSLAGGKPLPAPEMTASIWLFGAYCNELDGDNSIFDHGSIKNFIEHFGGQLARVPFSRAGVVFYGELLIEQKIEETEKPEE